MCIYVKSQLKQLPFGADMPVLPRWFENETAVVSWVAHKHRHFDKQGPAASLFGGRNGQLIV